jgi:hypothetical protein
MSKKVVERQADYTSCLDVDTINSLTESQRPSQQHVKGCTMVVLMLFPVAACLCVFCESAVQRLASDEDTQQT